MSVDVHLQTINAVHVKVCAEPGIIMEMAESFSFMAPNYRYHPAYKARQWSGKINLINRLNGVVYAGLAKRIKQWCDAREYTMSFDEGCSYESITRDHVDQFVQKLGLPDWMESREFQLDGIHKALTAGRRTLLMPTSAGKSSLQYILTRWYNKKTLIIVPSNGLVDQMKSDFLSYGYEGVIATSKEKVTKTAGVDADVFICTWQSIDNGKSKAPKEFLQQFEVVMVDECHGAKSSSIIKILSTMTNCYHRFGFTGTLDGEPLTLHTVEGLLGPEYRNITTRELIDQGYATNVKIKCVVLKYPKEVAREFRKINQGKVPDYHQEINWITKSDLRNAFIKKLVNGLNGNRLVFFKLREHGKTLSQAFEENENFFYIDGGIKDRETIRKAIEDLEDAILLASSGTTATGTSIRKLHYMINTHPMKGQIKLLQAIGRMLRQHADKEVAIVYDIVDDMSTASYKNYTLKHFEERAKIYDREAFDYSIYTIQL